MDDQAANQDPNQQQAGGGQPTPPQPPTPPTPPTPPAGQAGGQPAGAQPGAGQPPAGQAAGGNDLSGIMEENVDVSGLIANAGNQQQKQDFIASVTVPPHPKTTFDDKEFVTLLAGSISLTVGEKHNIIKAVPQLSQFQIDELIKIFKEEQQKFAELEKKHAEQVAQLEKQHKEGSAEALQDKAQEEEKKQEEDSEADEIRKSLGL